MASSGSAIQLRRRGSSRRIPWEYVSLVLVTVFVVFFFLYFQALSAVVQHSQPSDSNSNSDVGIDNHINNNHPSENNVDRRQQVLVGAGEEKSGNVLKTTGGSNNDNKDNNKNDILVLSTQLGDIRIRLRKDLSPSSIDYIHQMVATSTSQEGGCPRCSFYRAETGGILQGIMKNPKLPATETKTVVKGDCPTDLKDTKYAKTDCHGPIMEHGMVGWAGGKVGPDFFIDWYKRPAKFWGAQHTVWGDVLLEESTSTIDEIWKLPANKRGGLTYLVEPLKFQMSIV